jgi:hypothetical protein
VPTRWNLSGAAGPGSASAHAVARPSPRPCSAPSDRRRSAPYHAQATDSLTAHCWPSARQLGTTAGAWRRGVAWALTGRSSCLPRTMQPFRLRSTASPKGASARGAGGYFVRPYRIAASVALISLVLTACAESDVYRSRSRALYADYIGGAYGRSSGFMSPYDCWRSSSRVNCP